MDTVWWQYSDGHWDGEKEEDQGVCPPAGWGVVELQQYGVAAGWPRGWPRDGRSFTSSAEFGTPNMENRSSSPEQTDSVNVGNIPIAQFGGDGPDWGKGRARITAAACGEVVTAVEDWRHIGAAAQTNNTGELTGM